MNERQETSGSPWPTLRRRWWVPALAVLLGIVAAVGAASQQAKRYTASASVLLNQSGIVQELFGPVAAPVDPSRTAQTNLELANSQIFVDGVARRLRITPTKLTSQTSVTVGVTSDILSFSATAGSPGRAAQIANAMANSFVRFRGVIASSDVAAAQRGLQAQLTALGRRTDLTRAQRSSLRSALQQRLSAATALGGVSTSGTQLGSPAVPPSKPSSPSLARSAALGGAIGALLGLALLVLLVQLDRRLGSVPDAVDTYGLPLLGLIPDDSGIRRSPDLASLPRPAREALDRLAVRLMQTLRRVRGDGTQVLMITSTGPNFGKTTIVRQLAGAVAALGHRVVAVDADLRQPGLAIACGVEPDAPGLSDALLEDDPRVAVRSLVEIEVDVEVYAGVQHTTSFALCPAGPALDHPGSVLSGDTLAQVFGELRELADVVLVDTGPLGAASEPLIVLQHVDAVLIVSRMGVDDIDMARGVVEDLRAFDAVPIGMVLNRVRGGVPTYGYKMSGAARASK